jgi:OOP family OmpA-OmpF porin
VNLISVIYTKKNGKSYFSGGCMKFSKLKTVMGTIALIPAIAFAGDVDTQSGFSLGAGLGVMDPTGDRNLDSDGITAFNGAYRFDPNWEVEVTALGGELSGDGASNNDADVRNNRLDFNYYLNNGHWQPYLSVGAGKTKYDYDQGDSVDDSPLDFGLGLKYFLNPSWYARGDVRGFNTSDGTDKAITFSVGHMFNQHKKLPPADSDNDGVIDDLDQCPGTPAGASVDENGCPTDTDGDGVLDYMDQCPNSSAGAEVNESGCENVTMSMSLTVEFANNSAALETGSNPDIDAAVAFLSTHTNVSASIEGHTDSNGEASYNQMLSEKRAKAAADRLIEQGVDASRVTSVGYGETKPIADNNTREGRQANRRIVAVLEAEEAASE